jgi:heptosyltransferase-2
MKRRFPWKKRAIGAVFDLLTAPIAIAVQVLALFRGVSRETTRRILVVEIWGIGDAVLATAALVALRRALPNAHLTVLVKPHAAALFDSGELVDEVIAYDFPWTSVTRKYLLARYDLRSIWLMLRRLRAGKYDLSIDARMDPRSNLLTLLAGVRRRIGYAHAAGSWLLTDRVPVRDPDEHRVDDWLQLVRAAGIPAEGQPTLGVSGAEKHWAKAWLAARGLDAARRLIGIHPGASNPVRRWDLARFGAVADAFSEHHDAQIIVFADDTGYGEQIPMVHDHAVARVSIRELMALVSHCDLLVCNESGPMHIAGALGTPVLAIFTSMLPAWFGPRAERDRVVIQSNFPCRPCFDRCKFAEPYCNTNISVAAVLSIADEQFSALAVS